MRARIPGLVAVAALVLAVTAAPPRAVAADVEPLRDRAQSIADRVTVLERQLRDLRTRSEALESDIGSAGARIGILELELDEAERSLATARDILEARAAEMYKASTTSTDIEMLLSARDMSELAMLVEVQSAAAIADQSAVDDLESIASQAEEAQTHLEERKSRLLDAHAEVSAIQSEIATHLNEREDVLMDLFDQIEELQEQARLAEAEAAGGVLIPSNLPAPTGDLAARLVGTGPSHGVPPGFTTTGITFEGEASWYGPGFEGNHTASGDVYDSSLFTVASKTLPLNTYLYIEYEGRGIVVLVNDRGPYAGNRILDLSRGSAAAIGMERAGVGWVTAEIIVRG